ncbi:hypothetical protein PHMEG_00033614 [Phytophthora megakarya]|uniref:Uncharacterized protein n=1 Tax=Phytophthora megakarya TaxID=4795 RepID=A0A225USP8_9STRA|nr:hypothetical protein PHMEG_00033614 [Phytophthora megakarya]
MNSNVNTVQALTCVHIVCRNGPEMLRFPHVVKSLHEFLNWGNKIFLYKACKVNFQHLVELKLAVYSQECTDSRIFDPHFRQWQFTKSLLNSMKCGNLELVKMLSNHFLGCDVVEHVLHKAADLGRSEIFKWLYLNRPNVTLDYEMMSHALLGNDLELAKWLKERVQIDTITLHMKSTWVSVGARYGNLDMVNLFENLDLRIAVADAVKHGQLRVLQWLLPQNDTESRDFCFDLDEACKNDHLELVEWLIQHYQKKCCITHADKYAARHGRLDIVRLLHTNNVIGCSRRAIRFAASEGHLDIVKWLQSCTHRKFSILHAIDGAAANGHLDVVKWLHENTDDWCGTAAMDGAARNGHLETVQWLHEHRPEGCTSNAMDQAASKGNLEIVQFLRPRVVLFVRWIMLHGVDTSKW